MKTMNSRRNFLRGAGVALTLPWLESLAPRVVKGAATKPPTRLGVMYFSNGVEPMHWWAKGAGQAAIVARNVAHHGATPVTGAGSIGALSRWWSQSVSGIARA